MGGLSREMAMPKPYSADLRERVLLADEAGLSPAVIAARFGIGVSTVYLWRQQARTEDRRYAKPHGGGRARDRRGGRGDPAGAGGRAQRSHAGRIQGALGGTHRAGAGQPTD